MGVSSSSPESGAGKPADFLHSELPVDTVPYKGPAQQFAFVDVTVKLQSHASFTMAKQMITTDVGSYYPVISQPYAQGFVLEEFLKVPGAASMSSFTSVESPYQAILSRPVVPTGNLWQLKIVKASLDSKYFFNSGKIFTTSMGTSADTSDIHKKVAEHTGTGARLMCITLSGHQQGPTYNEAMKGILGTYGVDIFLSIPTHPNPKLYLYNAISVPINYIQKPMVGVSDVKVDWFGQMYSWLDKGWKLVDIFLDSSEQTTNKDFTSISKSMNSIWFFEKETERADDPTPLYEGTIVEFWCKSQAKFGGTYNTSDWKQMVVEMGERGWQLATTIQSPECLQTGFATVKQKMLFFFQRPLNPSPSSALPSKSSLASAPPLAGQRPLGAEWEQPGAAASWGGAYPAAPPSYEEVVQQGDNHQAGPLPNKE